jgi:hypothetical protein
MSIHRTIFLMLIFCFGEAFSQTSIPIGTWRAHPPYYSVLDIALTENFAYAVSPYASFYIDKTENSFNPLSKIQGLTDVGISAVGYDKVTSTVVIGYENGNIDLIKDREIINMPDITRATIVGSKKLNHISFHKGFAYVSSDFGMVVLNLAKVEVKESYRNLSESGDPNIIYSSAIIENKDSIYIATESGILSAKISSAINLMDYKNWYLHTNSDGIPAGAKNLAALNGKMYASIDEDGIYEYTNNAWTRKNWVAGGLPIYGMNSSKGELYICADGKIFHIDKSYNVNIIDDRFGIFTPVKAICDDNNQLWIADRAKGLVKYDGDTYFNYLSESPYHHNSFKLYTYGDKLINLTGGYTNIFGPLFLNRGYHTFQNNKWSTNSTFFDPNFPDVRDIVDAAIDPIDKSLYIASALNGLLTVSPEKKYNLIGTEVFASPDNAIVRITGLATDSKGRLWVSNHSVPAGSPSIYMKERSGAWKGFTFTQTEARFPSSILIDDLDNKWVRLGNSGNIRGLMVFNEEGNKRRFLTTNQGSGGLPDIVINCFAKDKNGEIWIGTNQGVAVFQNPSLAFDSNQDVILPIFDGFPLLKDEVVTAIKIDGANRKWFGTNNGVWLLDRSAREVLHNFTEDNSPLPSNNITGIEILPSTGEVFFGTDKGIISFRGTATEAEATHGKAKVFPNPVKAGFGGTIGITGLANSASVKITDIYGNLISEGEAQGGMYTWNGRNYNGEGARAGVYLVFSSTSDGEDTNVAKILVIQ